MVATFGSQSMIARLRRVIVKRPQEAYCSPAVIAAEWKSLGYTGPPDFDRAIKEHERFVAILRDAGAEVLTLRADARTGLDSIYPHDPVLITDAGAVVFQTGKKARQGEGPALADALRAWAVPILGVVAAPAHAEGGDLLWLDRQTLFVGRGFRTNEAGVSAVRALLEPLEIRVVEAHLPCWNGDSECLHLQSVISLIDDDLAVVYRKLLPIPLFEHLSRRGVQLVDVPEDEYATLGCNVLALAPRQVVMLSDNPITRSRLEAADCAVNIFEGREIAWKGAGGPTCLTRPLWRA